MTNFTKVAAASVLAGLLFGTPAVAQEGLNEGGAWEEDAWDGDGDGLLSFEEFAEGFALRVDVREWDLDGDGLLSEDEFLDAIYTRYDADTTGAFDEAERGIFERDFGEEGLWRRIGGELVEEASLGEDGAILDEEEDVFIVPAWDIDGDGVILSEEFAEGFREWGTFREFDEDVDGFVSPRELAAAIFLRYDEDGTGFIEEAELQDIGDDMGDEGFWDM